MNSSLDAWIHDKNGEEKGTVAPNPAQSVRKTELWHAETRKLIWMSKLKSINERSCRLLAIFAYYRTYYSLLGRTV